MNDRVFTQANLVFIGRLRDNKEKGLDTSTPRTCMDVEKLFKVYFPKSAGDKINTEILLHKMFFDIMYYTGRRAKEGLRDLNKQSFIIKKSANGKEYIELTFNEKTKKNQGDSMSTAANALHNDHHVITEITDSELYPIQTFKRYKDLLHPDVNAFFQKPNKDKTGFTREVLGKNTLGSLMKEISKQAGLSKIYTNHQIRKTTATGLHQSGFTLQEIANVTKHKNLDSLKHYISGPTMEDKQTYNDSLFCYGNKEVASKRKQDESPKIPMPKISKSQNKENVITEEQCNETAIPYTGNDDCDNQLSGQKNNNVQSVVTNQLRQAPNLFQNANFNNCNFTFSMPQ